MKKIMISLRNILMLMFCFIFAINLMFFSADFFARDDLPELFGYTTQNVVDPDVTVPAASKGDMLIFKDDGNYRPNDVVICNKDGVVYTCRIIGEASNGYIAHCDSNSVIDGAEIPAEQIEGKMVAVLPGIGNVISVIQSVPGSIVLFVLAFLLLETPKFVEFISRQRRNEYIA